MRLVFLWILGQSTRVASLDKASARRRGNVRYLFCILQTKSRLHIPDGLEKTQTDFFSVSQRCPLHNDPPAQEYHNQRISMDLQVSRSSASAAFQTDVEAHSPRDRSRPFRN